MEGFYGSNSPIQAKVKRTEMTSPDARYIFVRELRYGSKAYETASTQRICEEGIAGFVHYRFTLEEEVPVLYVYEIQLESRIQGKGLGEFLMQLIELIASKVRGSLKVCFIYIDVYLLFFTFRFQWVDDSMVGFCSCFQNQMSAIVLTVQTSNALAMTFYMSKLG